MTAPLYLAGAAVMLILAGAAGADALQGWGLGSRSSLGVRLGVTVCLLCLAGCAVLVVLAARGWR